MNAPLRRLVVEHRSLADTPQRRPRADAAAQLREIAGIMQHLPRECLHDPAELFVLMRRLAGRIVKVADVGLEAVPSHRARPPRQPFLVARPIADARSVAASVFGATARRSGAVPTTVRSRTGRTVKVEVRRRALIAAGQTELAL